MDAPEHGSVAVSGTTYGNVATYTCEENFEVSGVVNRQCMSDGQWSAAKPTCILQGRTFFSGNEEYFGQFRESF